jgi:hypothetical protein
MDQKASTSPSIKLKEEKAKGNIKQRNNEQNTLSYPQNSLKFHHIRILKEFHILTLIVSLLLFLLRFSLRTHTDILAGFERNRFGKEPYQGIPFLA